jgi:superfamily II DNA or RNA helicase
MTEAVPQAGRVVRVRSRQYLVQGVEPPPNPGDQHLVRLACLDDDAQGQPLEVLWEKEIDAEVLGQTSWAKVAEKGFDPPKRFSAYLHTLRWNCVTSTDPKLFQSPYRAGIQVLAYQLEPLRKALRLPRVNLFIADDVGLGKTIEAGLIVRELLMRQKVRRIVVAAPPSVVLQWRDELETRFGLPFVVFDRQYVLGKREERGYGVNPWNTHSRFIISHALLRDEAYAGPLRAWLDQDGRGTLLILDEAHNAAPASGARYGIDSILTRIVRDLAPRFEHRLFLSATPHNGHSNSFAALLELLDPQRFCRGVPVKGEKQLEPVMVRRLKEDLRKIGSDFPRRDIPQIDIDGLPADAPELRLSQLLSEYADLRTERLRNERKSVQNAAALITTSLQKRLLSSIEAFARTLAVHRRSIEKQEQARGEAGEAENLSLLKASPDRDDERAELDDEQITSEEDAQMEAASRLASTTTAATPEELKRRERALLDEMTRIAEGARGLPDPRVQKLIDWIRTNLCPDLPGPGAAPSVGRPRWNNRRVLIFTEYTDTKRYLEQQLRAAIESSDRAEERVATLTGGMGEERREEIKRAFNMNPAKHPLRILIATDAAREGVNLQNYCADLFHFDVPWNPSRMEQRNGRIDRKLQRAPEVRCHYFFFKQRPEDQVLAALVKKTDTIQRELGSLTPVVDRRLEKLLEGGIRRQAVGRLAREIEAEEEGDDRARIEEELEAAREREAALQDQLEQLRNLLKASKEALGLDEDRFRQALSCALELLGSTPLQRANGVSSSDETQRWIFPELDKKVGADPTWAETLDALRPPRGRDEKYLEWRSKTKPRPIVFEDPGTLDEEVVHLHLEHRVVQRLLGRFLSQGFVHHDLSRACVGQADDAIRRVIVLGRLSLYGDRAARLHDEIVTVAARWIDLAGRKGPLRPFAEAGSAETQTIDLLEKTLADGKANVPKAVQDMLLAALPQDVADLLPQLQVRAEELASRAKQKLMERGTREAKEMADILEAQRRRIGKALQEDPQRVLEFDELEKRQLEAERNHMRTRASEIGGELAREPDRIRASYTVKAQRLEPVGVVYLWPVSG